MNGTMHFALSVMENKPFTPESWAKAAEVTLLGMGMIFLVLSILWGILAIFKLVFAREKKSKVKADNIRSEESVSEAVTAPAEKDDSELIAVITAAVAAYRESESADGAPVSGFRVVSFKRANTGRAWNSNK